MFAQIIATRTGYRPYPFGETPIPLLFEASKDGRSGGCPAGWGAGLAPLAKRPKCIRHRRRR
jgi:hypothetical protein